jgi:sortase A
VRRLALALIVVGLLGVVVSARLVWIGQSGQLDARARWESESSAGNADGLSHLSFPAQHREYYVTEGASEHSLELGPVHVAGTARPGEKGNCIIAAHRDTHFRMLKDIKRGDDVLIEQHGRGYHYRIVELHVVSKHDVTFYRPTMAPVLTLVTCYPFFYLGTAPKRFIVRAELLGSETRSGHF